MPPPKVLAPQIEKSPTKETLKLNLLNLVNDHRRKCGENCNVSLLLVRFLAERAGLTFTLEERKLFF